MTREGVNPNRLLATEFDFLPFKNPIAMDFDCKLPDLSKLLVDNDGCWSSSSDSSNSESEFDEEWRQCEEDAVFLLLIALQLYVTALKFIPTD